MELLNTLKLNNAQYLAIAKIIGDLEEKMKYNQDFGMYTTEGEMLILSRTDFKELKKIKI